jgi:hypothetical protein
MEILNAMDLASGKRAVRNKSGQLSQPIQFLSMKEKDDEWREWNMDWLETQGLQQIRKTARKLLKNYKLAKGIIDKSDYIAGEENEYSELIETLTKEDESALELKFYPIIPSLVNVLSGEFSKRVSKIMFRAIDDISHNEMLDEKRQMIEDTLLQSAERKMAIKLMEQGFELDSEEAQRLLNPESLKSLPEIEEFFKKDYRSTVEEWATHQKQVDEERFYMYELENIAFRDMLITDREFWHFRMMEDDYEVELWNPVLTFYHKSPEVPYISQGNFAGKIDLLTISDVIDKYGYLMNAEQLESLETLHPAYAVNYGDTSRGNDGSFYDATKSKQWNQEGHSLGMRQYMSVRDSFIGKGDDILTQILSDGDSDIFNTDARDLLRVTTAYWKTQRRMFFLTKKDMNGNLTTEYVDETYKVTDKPVYNTTLFKEKSERNLVFGEHLEPLTINEVWGGVKVGMNSTSFYNDQSKEGWKPIYLGINRERPSRLPFQFKGDYTVYGCKLPVEGSIFSERNTRSVSFVDLLKAFQIGYNMVNNQISDILVDELGSVILLDQNALPRHSMGEDWGKNNLAKAFVAMKNFQMLPLDTTITNTENALHFQHFQHLNLEQTNRLLGRIQLANYFKMSAMETVGITPQRVGTVSASESATGTQTAVNNSYAQTEMYFTQHSDFLMPRVHQMRTDLAQYYHSTKPSVRLQYITSQDEKVNFNLNGTYLLSRDLNVFCTTKMNHRAIMEQLRQLAVQNNTAGASIYDLGNVIKAESIAEITHALKASEEKMNAARQQDMEHQQKMQEQQLQANAQTVAEARAYESDENQKDRQRDVVVAEIRAAGYGAMQDIDQNQQSDYLDALKQIQSQAEFQQTMGLNTTKEQNRMSIEREKMNLKRQELASKERQKEKDYQIARENKTRDELIADKKLKNQKSK